MTITANIVPGTIIILKFPFDELVVGEVIEQTKDSLVLKFPCKVTDVIDSASGETYTMIKLWNRFSNEDTTEVPIASTTGLAIANKNLSEARKKYLDNNLSRSPMEYGPEGQHERSECEDIEDKNLMEKLYNAQNFHNGNDTLH